jgi:hypothetical protein
MTRDAIARASFAVRRRGAVRHDTGLAAREAGRSPQRLVDEGILDREHGEYRRTGGTFDPA